MIGVILTGHGKFSDGLESAVKLISGDHENFETINFLPNEEEVYPQQLKNAINNMEHLDGIVIFTDLLGGTPFRIAATLAVENDKCEVLSGTNLSMLIETLLSRNNYSSSKELATQICNTGKNQVIHFDKSEFND